MDGVEADCISFSVLVVLALPTRGCGWNSAQRLWSADVDYGHGIQCGCNLGEWRSYAGSRGADYDASHVANLGVVLDSP